VTTTADKSLIGLVVEITSFLHQTLQLYFRAPLCGRAGEGRACKKRRGEGKEGDRKKERTGERRGWEKGGKGK